MYAVTFDEVYGRRSLKIEASYDNWAIGVFATRDFARCEEANHRIQEFIAEKTGTEMRSVEFSQALDCFPKSEIEKLFLHVYVAEYQNIYSPEGVKCCATPYGVTEGEKYIVRDAYTSKWCLLENVSYGGETIEHESKYHLLFADQIIDLGHEELDRPKNFLLQ